MIMDIDDNDYAFHLIYLVILAISRCFLTESKFNIL